MSQHSRDEGQEHAALYVVGALPEHERREFEAHLAGCSVCREEIAALDAVAAHIGQSARPQRPSAEVRSRVLVATATGGAAFTQDGVHFVRGRRVQWEPSRVPKLHVKQLFFDAERGYSTNLVRMEPGGSYPAHRHADVEELYVLEGEVTVSGVVMRAGDYCRAEAESLHTGISTRDGCVFIAIASVENEFLT